ncbi:MAG: SpoIIE family protein phosphatase [Polyangia bacterium]
MSEAYLVAVDGHLIGRRFPLAAPCLVGRGPYNHIVLDDTRISRQHAKVSPEAGGHVVYDLNSANGTYVNDAPVKRQTLTPNDVVRFGPFTFRFESNVRPARPSQVVPVNKFLEVNTLVGQEPAPSIVGSLDVSSSSPGFLPMGLTDLEDSERKLRTLYSLMNSMASTIDAEELMDRVLQHLLDVFPKAETVMIYVRDVASGSMVPRKVQSRDEEPVAYYALAGQYEQEVVGRGRAVLSQPTGAHIPVQALGVQKKALGLSMHAPMIYGAAAHGVLHVRGRDHSDAGFTQADLDLLSTFAAQAAMALQNAKLHQETLKQQRLQQDLALAEEIQKSFLPQHLPDVPGIEFVAHYRPAYSVGGDFYDVFWLDDRRIGVFLGDVSGKGVSAALLMARISSDLRVAAMAERDPASALRRVNRLVLERNQHDIFVTGIYLTFDTLTREVVIANAGHIPPYVRRKGEGELFRVDQAVGTPIGAFEEAGYEPVVFTLGRGESIVLTTDGVLEATSPRGEQFGFPRMEASLAQGSSRAGDIVTRLLTDIHNYVGDAQPYDDLTLIAFGLTEIESEKKDRTDRTDSYSAISDPD